MSMDYCHSCDRYIDTDFDCEFYDDGKAMCAGCREASGEETEQTAYMVAQRAIGASKQPLAFDAYVIDSMEAKEESRA